MAVLIAPVYLPSRCRLPWLPAVLCLISVGHAIPGAAQTPYGMGQRLPNTSLLIDLSTAAPPATIALSGLYADIARQVLAPGIIPYGVNSPLWSDGAHKSRYLALPGDTRIGFSRDGDWEFPANTVLVKNFYLDLVVDGGVDRRLVETRFLVKVGASIEWRGFSYQWNEEGTDAELLTTGKQQVYTIVDPADPDATRQIDYLYPSPEACGSCHTYAAGQVLGPRTSQLNGTYDYDGIVAQQLATLNHIGLFTEDIGEAYEEFPRLEDPLDETASIEGRARSYLQTNCAHCHLPGGLRRTEIDLRITTPLAAAGIVDQVSGVDDLGGSDRRILKPGAPDDSVLLLRTLVLGEQRMPPLASGLVDVRGTNVLRRWIESLGMATYVGEIQTRPAETQLGPSYPNPFNGSTVIRYSLETNGIVELTIYDILGRRVRGLVAGSRAAGDHAVTWDGRDDSDRAVASGVYLLHLGTAGSEQTRRLTLLR